MMSCNEQFSLELAQETRSRHRCVAEIRWRTVPGHWTQDGKTARPITGQPSVNYHLLTYFTSLANNVLCIVAISVPYAQDITVQRVPCKL